MRAALFALLLLGATTALADDRARAEQLFQEGRALMEQGKTAEACAKLEASDKLDAATGTELNLAMCWEKLGKTASAWSLFVQLSTTQKGARARFAADHAARLRPLLSMLVVTVATPNAYVTVDGVTLPVAEYGVAVPVDPGPHVVDASAAGKHFHRAVNVGTSAATVTVAVAL